MTCLPPFGSTARKTLAALGVGLLCATASSLAAAADKVVAQLDWLPSGDKAAFYVGLSEGFYAEQGLDVVIQTGRGSSDALTKVATGVADVGSAGFSALLSAAAQNKMPVKAVYAYFTELPDSFLTVKGSGITSIKDLAGSKVGATALSSSRVLMPMVLEKNGLKPEQVQTQLVDANVLAPMLASGKVDAISAFRTQSALAAALLKERGKEMVVLPWSAFGLQSYGTVVVASDKMIEQRPDVLKRFVAAFNKSVDYALAHPDAAGRAVKKAAPEIDEAVARAQFESAMPLIRNAVSERDGRGVFSPALVTESWNWVVRSENLQAISFDPQQAVYRGAMPAK